jgi:hypothetical protein
VIIYVDDILIYGHNVKDIDKFIYQMKTEDVKLHKEGTAEGYLGVDIQRDGNIITFTQIASLNASLKLLVWIPSLLQR